MKEVGTEAPWLFEYWALTSKENAKPYPVQLSYRPAPLKHISTNLYCHPLALLRNWPSNYVGIYYHGRHMYIIVLMLNSIVMRQRLDTSSLSTIRRGISRVYLSPWNFLIYDKDVFLSNALTDWEILIVALRVVTPCGLVADYQKSSWRWRRHIPPKIY
jgi:hypothetical protein